MTEKHSFSIIINSTNYHLEEDLEGEEAFHLKAELIDPLCGTLNITVLTWSGVIEGGERKVKNNKDL